MNFTLHQKLVVILLSFAFVLDSDSNEDDIEILPNLQLKLPDKGKKKDKSAKKLASLQKELVRLSFSVN